MKSVTKATTGKSIAADRALAAVEDLEQARVRIAATRKALNETLDEIEGRVTLAIEELGAIRQGL